MPHFMNQLSEDPRGLYEKLRRTELYAILDAEGISYPIGVAADSAREILKSTGITPDKYVDQQGQFRWPEAEQSKKDNNVKSYEKMKMHELRKYCTQQGVEYTFKDKKADLIEKLENV